MDDSAGSVEMTPDVEPPLRQETEAVKHRPERIMKVNFFKRPIIFKNTTRK